MCSAPRRRGAIEGAVTKAAQNARARAHPGLRTQPCSCSNSLDTATNAGIAQSAPCLGLPIAVSPAAGPLSASAAVAASLWHPAIAAATRPFLAAATRPFLAATAAVPVAAIASAAFAYAPVAGAAFAGSPVAASAASATTA